MCIDRFSGVMRQWTMLLWARTPMLPTTVRFGRHLKTIYRSSKQEFILEKRGQCVSLVAQQNAALAAREEQEQKPRRAYFLKHIAPGIRPWEGQFNRVKGRFKSTKPAEAGPDAATLVTKMGYNNDQTSCFVPLRRTMAPINARPASSIA
jgi:hypothetical protein